MCTSFIYRKGSKIIGMNFDNNGMAFAVNTSKPGWFTVDVDGGRGKCPSFGVSQKGEFFNNLTVDSNGMGLYRRPSKKVTHTSKLVADIRDGNIELAQFAAYLQAVEVVNTPNWSSHNMIADSEANVWVVEPGRGNLYSGSDRTPYFVMTNFPLSDNQTDGDVSMCSRYQDVSTLLEKAESLTVDDAFEILAKTRQSTESWQTEFSLVYSELEQKVYYCLNGNFEERYEYFF